MFSHLAGIDVLIVKRRKKEVAFVCDKGNSSIRFINGVHSFLSEKFVGTPQIHPIPANWKPGGIAVIGQSQLAISDKNSIYLVCLNAALTAGELVSVIDHLQSPHGLCLSNDEDVLFVADGHTVKEINLQTKYVNVIARGFKQAFDVSLSKDGKLGIMDVQAHKAFILEKTEKGDFEVQRTIGTGTPGICDGPSSDAQLFEPTGLCFDFDSAIICCFGGNTNGCIKLHSEVDFACMFMSKIRQIYHAIGFRCKKEQNLAQVGKNPEIPFVKGTTMLADSLAYLDSLISLRKDYLKLPTAGPEGTVYHASIQGFSETVTALLSHIQSFQLLGEQGTIENLSLYAFVNESRKEHGFAKHKQQGQLVPTPYPATVCA